MRTIHSRIKYLRESAGLTQNELAEKLGLTDVAISRWELGITSPRSKTLINMANLFGVTVDWIKRGVSNKGKFQVIDIPFYTDINAAAGHGCFSNEADEHTDIIPLPKSYLGSTSSFNNVVCISVHGNSMEPVIRDNGIIAIDLGNKIIKDGNIYVICHNEMLRIKILYKRPLGLKIVSYNPDYEDEFYEYNFLSESDFAIIGQVVWYSSAI